MLYDELVTIKHHKENRKILYLLTYKHAMQINVDIIRSILKIYVVVTIAILKCNHGTWSVMLQSALFAFKGSEDRHLQIGHVLFPFTVGMISSEHWPEKL